MKKLCFLLTVSILGAIFFPVGAMAAPAITSITPNAAVNLGAVQITNLEGSGFVVGAVVTLTRAGQPDIWVMCVVESSTKIVGNFYTTGVEPGAWNIVVTNPDETSGTLNAGFTLNTPPAPIIISNTPELSGNRGIVRVELNGENFLPGAHVKLVRDGFTAVDAIFVSVKSATAIICDFNFNLVEVGHWDIQVINPDGQTGLSYSIDIIEDTGSEIFLVAVNEDFYVDAATGVDGNQIPYSHQPWQTLTYALNHLSGTGITLHAAAGTYDATLGEVFPLPMRDGISLVGAGAATTIIDAQNTAGVISFYNLGAGEAISGFTITNGSASSNGGGIYCDNSDPAITDCQIVNNRAITISSGSGGGVFLSQSSPVFTNCIISNNEVSWGGGGVSCRAISSPSFTDCNIDNNSADVASGGVEVVDFSAATFTNCTINQNNCKITGGTPGGGILFYNNCSGSFINCTISGNTADWGGGFYGNLNNSLTFTNCVITNNTAAGSGGGLLCQEQTNITLTNCTVSGNTAPSQPGGGLYSYSSTVTLINSIFWGDTPNEFRNFNSAINASYSNIQVPGGPTVKYPGAGNLNEDPKFASIVDSDFHIKPDSPCVNAGINLGAPTDDRDGTPRNDGRYDIGAYEFFNAAPVADAGADIDIWTIEQDNTTILGTATDGEGDPLTYCWFDSTSGARLIGSDPDPWPAVYGGEAHLDLVTLGTLSVGTHTFTLRITDGMDEAADDMVLTVKPNTAPVATVGADVTIWDTEQGNTIINGTGTDADSHSLTYRWLELTTVLLDWTNVVSLHATPLALSQVNPPLAVGVHTLTLEVTDGMATDTVDMVLTIEVLDPPVANAGGPIVIRTIDQEDTIINGTATNADTYSWFEGGTVLLSGGVVDPSGNAPLDLFFVDPLAVGVHTLTLEVTKGMATDTDYMELTVNTTPPDVVGTGGGTYSVDGYIVDIPAGALDGIIELTVVPLTEPELSVPPPAGQLFFAGAVFGPAGTVFNAPITITMPLSDYLIPGDTYSLLIYDDTLNDWVDTGSVGTVAVDGYSISAMIDHFSELSFFMPNTAPVADAGADVTTWDTKYDSTIINGTATDVDGQALTYSWFYWPEEVKTFITSGVVVDPAVDDSAPLDLSLVVPPLAVGVHTLTLEVTDGMATTFDDMVLTIEVNNLPEADAEDDIAIFSYEQLITKIEGEAEDEDKGDILTYCWFELAGGIETRLTGNDGDAWLEVDDKEAPLDLAKLDILVEGDHILILKVSDGIDETQDDMIVTIKPNTAPIANAGDDFMIMESDMGSTVIAGTAIDHDSNPLMYRWVEYLDDGYGGELENVLLDWEAATVVGGDANTPLDLSLVYPVLTEGSHKLTLEVTDDYGVLAIDEMFLTIQNNHLPEIDAGENLEILSSEQSLTILEGTATDADGGLLTYCWFDGNGAKLIEGDWPEVVGGLVHLDLATLDLLPVGEHTLTLKVTDGIDVAEASMILTVGNSPPEIAIRRGPGQYKNTKDIRLKARVADFDGGTLNYRWYKEGSYNDPFISGTIVTPVGGDPVDIETYTILAGTLSSGNTHIIYLEVSDGVNVVSTDFAVTIKDCTKPSISPELLTSPILWPADGLLHTVQINANAFDDSGEPVTLKVKVKRKPKWERWWHNHESYCTEPVIDGNLITLQLRAAKPGKGRTIKYEIKITAMDSSGNKKRGAKIKIKAPHKKRKKRHH